MLTPRDPDRFRAEVLRRAARIERRRRRARALMAVPVVLCVALAVVAVRQQRDGTSDVAAANEVRSVSLSARALPGGAQPWAVVTGPDEALYVLSRTPAPALLRVDGSHTERFELPSDAQPDALVAGTDGGIWMTDATSRAIRFDTGDDTLQSWPTTSKPSASGAWVDGRFWFAEPARDVVTGITRDGEQVHFDVPRGRAPNDVALGPDGSLWYASSTTPKIGSVSGSGTVNEIDLGDPDARASSLLRGPGSALWMLVTKPSGVDVAHLNARGVVVGDPVATPTPPAALGDGPNGRIWLSTGDGTLQLQSVGKLTVLTIARPLDAAAWTAAPDDSMWAVDRTRHELLRITID